MSFAHNVALKLTYTFLKISFWSPLMCLMSIHPLFYFFGLNPITGSKTQRERVEREAVRKQHRWEENVGENKRKHK